jgi:protein-S-isoprenylcysteine O-methyltransferase Ste14
MTILYKSLAVLVFAVFVFYVFDIRRKSGMVPIVAQGWTTVMKILSLVMLGLFAYTVLNLAAPTTLDWVGLGFTAVGASLVAAAKITLGRYHTWTGYHLSSTTIVQHGIYSRFRHPLYTGIFLFEFGGIALIVPHLPREPKLLVLVGLGFLYLMTFNVAMAARESREMKRKFGVAFDAYRGRVRAFIPVRRSGGDASGLTGTSSRVGA